MAKHFSSYAEIQRLPQWELSIVEYFPVSNSINSFNVTAKKVVVGLCPQTVSTLELLLEIRVGRMFAGRKIWNINSNDTKN